MPMLQYPLYDFVATVPSCRETTTLAVLLEIFAQQQCDRAVVVNEQEYPIGLLYSSCLIPQFLAAKQRQGNFKFLDLQQPISILDKALIEPIKILSASDNVDQFGLFLRSQSGESNNLNWALIDADKKYLGLVDTVSLLRLLAQVEIDASESDRVNCKKYAQKSRTVEQKNASSTLISKRRPGGACRQSPKQKEYQPQGHKPLVQLLSRLPWPLMLQTSSGEVITQNPAWWQQLGGLKDPEGVRQEVGEILNSETKSEYPTATIGNIINTCNVLDDEVSRDIQLNCRENTDSAQNEVITKKNLSPRRKTIPIIKNLPKQIFTETKVANRCLFDSNLGICTCVLEVQNGQERVWQFAKIPLDSIELKILGTELEMPYKTQESTGNELWLILATDVTEQQQLCKELAAKNADLVQLNRLKDEFLACISHELKTPLTAVLGLSRLLVDRQLGELNERQARYAGLIHQSGRHLMSVVNDILDLTRMETGQMELTLTPAKIRAVCDRAATEAKAMHTQNSKTPVNVSPQAPRSPDHQFTLSIEPGLDQIIADELRLRQMLVHLLSNAFKFTETGGEIGLRVSRWEGWIAFTVWDTGIGIPEHQQHLIFQKFQQLENPLTRQFEGTGLGLVLTRALARLHGGDVSFLSREGKGSQFTLLLPPSPPKTNFGDRDMGVEDTVAHKIEDADSFPVLPRSRNCVSSTPANLAASEQRLVLVVEAVARYIEELTEQLTGLGYRVVIARSGCEAVEKARRLQPKAVFLNPLLPLLSGWDVLTLIKSDAATCHIPVIVTATAAEKEQAFANSADGFISLPVQHQVLTPLLEKLCAAPEAQQPSQDAAKINIHTPLRILRLVNSELESVNPHPSLREHRVIEVDDLDQAELLARVWQFDVILLDKEVPQPEAYLQQLSQHPRLAALPLVTCDVATTLEASQVDGLSVFPCLSSFTNDNNSQTGKTDALLSVLQIASGMSCPPSLLVVDLTMLPDLPQLTRKQISDYGSSNNSALNNLTASRGSEWFQALIQYLQTAGLKAAMGRSWAEMLQQIRHHSVDLLLICLGESSNEKEARAALKTLGELPFDLPPILVLDQRLNPQEVSSAHKKNQKKTQGKLESIETVVDAIATQILPRSISMEDLLNQINQALKNG